MTHADQEWPFGSSVRRIGFLSPHPDDVELSCAVSMRRLRRMGHRVEYYGITNGAPTADAYSGIGKLEPGYDARSYQARRRNETETALKLIEMASSDVTFLDFPDLECYAHITALSRELATILGRLDAVVCCPFEGGHPDHDVLRFCLDAAAANQFAGTVIEYASYNRLGWQVFLQPDTTDIQFIMSAEERSLKARIGEVFESQREDASRFSLQFERFRLASVRGGRRLEEYLRPHEHPYYETFAYSQEIVRDAMATYVNSVRP